MQFIHCIALVIQHYAILFILQPYYKKHYKLLHNDYRDSNTLINKKLNHVSSCYPVKKKGYLSTFSDENQKDKKARKARIGTSRPQVYQKGPSVFRTV